jgi:hypothetical protein
MKSLLVESGVKKMVVLVAGLCVGVAILIAILEQVATLLAYYLA